MDHLPMPKFGPLAGLRVVFSGIEIAGPFAGQMFAEWGAEVPHHHYRMYSDDDSYVDGAAAFSERSATPPAGSDVLSQLVGAGKRRVL